LKRLASATTARQSNNWSDTFTYDEYGNLSGMTETGGAPSLSVGVNWQTNQISPTGIQYDSYGNVTRVPALVSTTLGYDVANRLVSVGGTQVYASGTVSVTGRPGPASGTIPLDTDNPTIGINQGTPGRFDWLDEPGFPSTEFGERSSARF
jgi:YD repeat-containing protein